MAIVVIMSHSIGVFLTKNHFFEPFNYKLTIKKIIISIIFIFSASLISKLGVYYDYSLAPGGLFVYIASFTSIETIYSRNGVIMHMTENNSQNKYSSSFGSSPITSSSFSGTSPIASGSSSYTSPVTSGSSPVTYGSSSGTSPPTWSPRSAARACCGSWWGSGRA